MAKIEQLIKEDEGEWLAIAVTKENIEGPFEGDLLFHSVDRSAVWESIKGDRRHIYVTFPGPMLKEGHAAAF